MAPNTILRSKWLLAALIILGLIYFEGRVHDRLVDREPTAASFAR
ncbi:hypothetical protein [Bdellovibrio bacteriovorus]